MLEIDTTRFFFKSKSIWFSENPFDITGYDGVSFNECLNNVDIEGFSKEEFTTLVIDLTQDLDTIWKKMHRNCRRSIIKAKKDGVTVRVNQDYEIFFKMNSEFRRLKGLSEYGVDVEFMKKNGLLFLSEFEGKIIGGLFYVTDGKNIRSLIGASSRLEENDTSSQLYGNSTRLRIWEAIKYSKEKGMITFDMGGYYTGKNPDPQKEGINNFKKSFGGELVTHYIYQKDYSKIYSLSKFVYKNLMEMKSLRI